MVVERLAVRVGGCGWLAGRLEDRLPRRLGWPSSNAGAEAPYDPARGAGAGRLIVAAV